MQRRCPICDMRQELGPGERQKTDFIVVHDKFEAVRRY